MYNIKYRSVDKTITLSLLRQGMKDVAEGRLQDWEGLKGSL